MLPRLVWKQDDWLPALTQPLQTNERVNLAFYYICLINILVCDTFIYHNLSHFKEEQKNYSISKKK